MAAKKECLNLTGGLPESIVRPVGKVVRITTDDRIEIVDCIWRFDAKRKLINADCLELVKTEIMDNLFSGLSGFDIVMCCDESFLIKDLPFNRIASDLYGYSFHGNPICGDVYLCELDPFGGDFPLLDPDPVAALLTAFSEVEHE